MKESLRQSPADNLHENAFITTASASLGVVASVILDALVMAVFGLSSVTDAYFVASTIPMVVTTVMALQASKVVLPMFINTREQFGEAEGWKLLNLFITIGTWVAIILAGICAALSPLIIRLQAPGFDPQVLALGSTLSYFFFLVLPLTWPAVIMRAALTSVGEFWMAGMGKFIESICKILSVVTLSEEWGIVSLAFGMLIGALGQLWLWYICLRRRGYRFCYYCQIYHPEIRRALGLMRYPLAGQGFGMLVEIMSNNLSSLLGSGKVTALRFATRIVDLLANVFVHSIITVAMPVVTSAVAHRDHKRATELMRHSIHFLLLVIIPVSLWLAMANRPLISLLYQRMNFTASDVDLVSGVLLVTIPYMFLSRLVGLAELPFFSSNDTRTPVLVSMAKSATCVLLMYLLFDRFELYAFPIARNVSYMLAAVYLLITVSSNWGDLKLRILFGPTVGIITASGVMSLIILLGQSMVANMVTKGILAVFIGVAVPSAVGMLSALSVMVALKIAVVRRVESFPFVGVRFPVP